MSRTLLPSPPIAAEGSPHAIGFDPDEYRMTLGEHLEELRKRLIYCVIGLAVAAGGSLLFGRQLIAFLSEPLITALARHGVNPQLQSDEVGAAFVTYLKVSLIFGLVLAGPWIVWQLWLFVAAGLYPNERKYVTRFAPLSIALLAGGVLFVYFFVLPFTVDFFVEFTTSIPLHGGPAAREMIDPAAAKQTPFVIPIFAGDPATPREGQIWYDKSVDRLKFYVNGTVHAVQFGLDNLISPHYDLDEYLGFVFQLLLGFGLGFQLPLVIMALIRIGIVEAGQFRAARRYVYFGIALISTSITPLPTVAVAMMVPLALLYELGIWLGAAGVKTSE